jgi:hypothetical protein
MNITPDKLILDAKSALLHRRVARPQLGYGSILLLDFADPNADGAITINPNVYMRIECSWRIELGGEVLAACEDSRERLHESVVVLNGRMVEAVDVSIPGLEVRISLSDDCRLCIFPIYAEHTEYENWTIGTADRMSLIAGPGRQIQCVPGDG